MPRYQLRTLLILMAILPPVLAEAWFIYDSWRVQSQLWAVLSGRVKDR